MGDLTVKPNTEVDVAINFEQDAGSGFENVSVSDISVPYITILQQLSPQLKKATKVEGAEEGHIFNTISKEVIKGDEGIFVIPCAYQKRFPEWKPRAAGGGLVTYHEDESILNECNQTEKGWFLPNGNSVVPTAYFYVLVLSKDGSYYPAVISMASTQVKKAKNWLSIMDAIRIQGAKGPFKPPMFANIYKLRTISESKNEFSWYGWDISLLRRVENMAVYETAKRINNEFKKGELKVVGTEEAEPTSVSASGVM